MFVNKIVQHGLSSIHVLNVNPILLQLLQVGHEGNLI
jgi:hypothetical protein